MEVAVMDADTISEVADVLRAPPNVGKYAALRRAILQRMTDSADHQLHKLLTGVELGDKKPSQLLREMRSLAKNRAGDDVIRIKWLDLLPPGTQRILRLFKDSKTLEELADAADEVHDCGPTVMATAFSAARAQPVPHILVLRQSVAQISAYPKSATGTENFTAQNSSRFAIKYT